MVGSASALEQDKITDLIFPLGAPEFILDLGLLSLETFKFGCLRFKLFAKFSQLRFCPLPRRFGLFTLLLQSITFALGDIDLGPLGIDLRRPGLELLLLDFDLVMEYLRPV